jgi:hypothetical protein
MFDTELAITLDKEISCIRERDSFAELVARASNLGRSMRATKSRGRLYVAASTLHLSRRRDPRHPDASVK